MGVGRPHGTQTLGALAWAGRWTGVCDIAAPNEGAEAAPSVLKRHPPFETSTFRIEVGGGVSSFLDWRVSFFSVCKGPWYFFPLPVPTMVSFSSCVQVMLLTFWCSSGEGRFMGKHCPWDGLERKSHSWAALFPGLN